MRLLIISDMAHYRLDGKIIGHGPTAREISYLASLFGDVRHLACLYPEAGTALFLPYETEAVRLVSLPPSGGSRFIDKLGILLRMPLYIYTILKELPEAEVVHVRCPANIPLIAIVLLSFVRHPRKRWIKYAGNWQPPGREALSYTFQRWWLRHGFAGGVVTVNGSWADQPKHIHSFYNPCLTDDELQEGRRAACEKSLVEPLRLVFVGRLDTAKGIERALHLVERLVRHHVKLVFDIVGDGSEREHFQQMADQLGITDCCRFHGWLPRPALGPLYAQAHLMLLLSQSEGWPKVLSEAMAYGVVPLASDVSSIPQYLRQFETGHAFPADSIEAFLDAILAYIQNPEIWKRESDNSVRAAQLFTYNSYLESVRKLLDLT